MSSSYIVIALFLLIKLNIFRPPPHLKTHRPIAHVCDKSQCITGEGMKQQEKGKRWVWSGANEIIYTTEKMVKYHVENKVLTETQHPE